MRFLNWGKKSWEEVIASVLELPPHKDLIIKKSEVLDLPSYFQDRLGDEDGQLKDYGAALPDGKGIHIKVYDNFYKIHWDKKDPNQDPIGHILEDAPHWILIAAGIVDEVAFKGKYRKKLKKSILDFIDDLF